MFKRDRGSPSSNFPPEFWRAANMIVDIVGGAATAVFGAMCLVGVALTIRWLVM